MADRDLSLILIDLIKKTGIPLRKFSKMSELGPTETLKLWNMQPTGVSLFHVRNFAKCLDLSEDQILDSTYDLNLARMKILGSKAVIPDRYKKNALSFNRSSAHIVECVALLRGRHIADSILTKIGVFPSYLQSLDNRISLNFFTDLLDEVAAIGIADNKLLSRAMILTIQDTPLGKKFAAARTYPEFYEVLKASTPLFDENFEYFFSISDTGMDLVTKPSELYLQGTSGRTMESAKLFNYREVVFGYMPILCGLPPLKLNVHSCISQGDPLTHYSVEFPNLSRF